MRAHGFYGILMIHAVTNALPQVSRVVSLKVDCKMEKSVDKLRRVLKSHQLSHCVAKVRNVQIIPSNKH